MITKPDEDIFMRIQCAGTIKILNKEQTFISELSYDLADIPFAFSILKKVLKELEGTFP